MMKERILNRLALLAAQFAAPELVYRPHKGNAVYDLSYDTFAAEVEKAIEKGGSFLVARMGSTEAINCLAYLRFQSQKQNLRLLTRVVPSLQTFSGVFPPDQQTVERFCQFYLDCLSSVDLLASWMQQEDALADYFSQPKRVFIEDIVPFVGGRPWSAALAGKRVLVVHPFVQSIQQQYARRELLFADPRVLPEFELIAYPAVQSLGGGEGADSFANWFEALEQMQAEISAIDFDVAILGCGAYGLPLGAYIKGLGKPAIHMGGVTQCLFGIKGRRWVEDYGWDTLYFNENWIYPDERERPRSADAVEGACYWGDQK